MATLIRVRHSERAADIRYEAPCVRLLSAESGLHDAMLSRLSPFEAGLAGVRLETQTPDLSAMNIACSVGTASDVVRFFADRIEVVAATPAGQEQHQDVSEAGARAVLDTNLVANFSGYSIALSFHAEFPSSTFADFIARFTRPIETEAFGTQPVAVVYNFELPGTGMGQVTLDSSVMLAGGLFARAVYIDVAKETSIEDAFARADKFFRSMPQQFLDVELQEFDPGAD